MAPEGARDHQADAASNPGEPGTGSARASRSAGSRPSDSPPAEPPRIETLLVLGASGDLASRLLLPALGQLLTVEPDRRILLVGAGAEQYDEEQWRTRVSDAFRSSQASGDAVDELLSHTRYRSADLTSDDGVRSVLDECEGAVAIYFALPPAITFRACQALERIGVPDGSVLGLEKPFGSDAASAHELNELVQRIVPERSIHRVDHFLGRTTVLNLLGLRFANRVFEPLWNSTHIERVDIVYDEELALENRARYYDHAGALVDMLQSHLLQVLAIFAMEPPATLGEADLRDAKSTTLRATQVWGGDAAGSSRRARYTAGRIGDRTLPAYTDEAGVDPSNETETLAELTVEVGTWRWAGVPFTLRSGKAIGRKRREIMVTFREAPRVPSGLEGEAPANVLHIALAPERIALELNMNGPGDPETLSREVMQADFDPGRLKAYGEVLRGILDGDPSLSIRADTAEQCWRIVEPVLEAWRAGTVPLEEYAAGSNGPDAWRTSIR
ncbi:glucose-6-phosphate dehydrogenase [Ruicaihuangia caeni]|uniref:Glucose-6-phosphate 1-dehydrogenase n=1 Tax=Ruicaihuangia caeni TaxID=3042517 RepID=A0AAW6T1W7_9MICO|nr:glucose-6-phosphate dehydrogenase [Klugiella sp. YN-L-19]MDI2097409.1 glucose-6-phosphate dehydrogenase [Klugiella sp. YN-L-19]